jgi:hypothetical protein
VNEENLNELFLVVGPDSVPGYLFSLMGVICLHCTFMCFLQLMNVVRLHLGSDIFGVLQPIFHVAVRVSRAAKTGRALFGCDSLQRIDSIVLREPLAAFQHHHLTVILYAMDKKRSAAL